MSLSLDFRELTSTVSLTSSWDDLSLHDEPMVTDVKRPKSFNEPLHIFTSPMAYSSSPSPTRLAKVYKSITAVITLTHCLLSVLIRSGVYCFYQFQQCFSPSLQQPIRNNTLTPSPSPSPTRKTFVR